MTSHRLSHSEWRKDLPYGSEPVQRCRMCPSLTLCFSMILSSPWYRPKVLSRKLQKLWLDITLKFPSNPPRAIRSEVEQYRETARPIHPSTTASIDPNPITFQTRMRGINLPGYPQVETSCGRANTKSIIVMLQACPYVRVYVVCM